MNRLPSPNTFRKLNTAYNLISAGEYERVQTILLTRVRALKPSWLPDNLQLRKKKRTTSNDFDPISTKIRTPLPRHRTATTKNLKVAAILDEFSQSSWSPEFELIELTPENWQEQFKANDIDFLFVESAWRGKESSWQAKIANAEGTDSPIIAITEYCHNNKIPTVFWNKEDPEFFNEFAFAASHFEFVFTTDSSCIHKYESMRKVEHAELLPFAAQPALHNPARNTPSMIGFPRKRIARGGVAFAGTYYAERFPDRKTQLDLILTSASKVCSELGMPLTIFSRMGTIDKRYKFPARFRAFVVGSLPYLKMLSAYQEHKLFLNVNTVTQSESMCARRLFEIPASGTLVVSTPSKAIKSFFPNGTIPEVASSDEAEANLRLLLRSKLLRDKLLHRSQRVIWNENTYAHRFAQIRAAIGKDTNEPFFKKVSIICSSSRPQNLQHLFKQIGQQKGVDVELVLGTHGFSVPKSEVLALSALNELSSSQVTVKEMPRTWSLGTCLNYLVAQSQFPVIAKMDDDDFYLPHYLEDLCNALYFSGADLVGKQALYCHLSDGSVVLRNNTKEHIYTNFVAGPTLLGYRNTFELNPFEDRTLGEDSAFLKSILAKGMKIYSADRFNFVQQRAGSHTWNIDDTEILSKGTVETWGSGIEHVRA